MHNNLDRFPFRCADDIELWMRWGYYLSPIMYGQNAISINEFLDNRWGNVSSSKHMKTLSLILIFIILKYFLSYLGLLTQVCMSQLTGSPYESTVGKSILKERGFFTDEYWYWICIGVLLGFSLIFNFLFIAALEFLNGRSVF